MAKKEQKVAKAKSATKNSATKGTKTTKERKKRAKKDPNAPKRACSAYIFYTKHRREPLTKEQPNLDHKQIISTLSKEWNALSESAKAPFNKQAENDKARYKKESASYKK